jgi:hypothetical protein
MLTVADGLAGAVLRAIAASRQRNLSLDHAAAVA